MIKCVPPTATNTPIPPTATNTSISATSTYTPTIELTAIIPYNSVSIKYKSFKNGNNNYQRKILIRLYNTSKESLYLDGLEIRYWFKNNDFFSDDFVRIDLAYKNEGGNINSILANTMAVVKKKRQGTQNRYISINFSGAGMIDPNDFIDIETTIIKIGGKPINQEQDWSYGSHEELREWGKIAVYRHYSPEVIIYGSEPENLPYELKVNCGSVFEYPQEPGWKADRLYVEGSWGLRYDQNIGWERETRVPLSELYRNYTIGYDGNGAGGFSYIFDNIPYGEYKIVLKFAEMNPSITSGQRKFYVAAENEVVIPLIDIYDEVGRDEYGYPIALDYTIQVMVVDGQLNLDFIPLVSSEFGPIISAIHILQVSGFENSVPTPISTCYVLDSSFGTGGIATYTSGYYYNTTANDITTDNSGRVITAGIIEDGTGRIGMAIWRYTSEGVLDTTFAGTGYVVHHLPGDGRAGAYGLTLDASGKILITGYGYLEPEKCSMVLCRYNEDGTIDTTFGVDGCVTFTGVSGGRYDWGNSVLTDENGKILVVGLSYNPDYLRSDMVIWRYNPDGTLDTSFGGIGYITSENPGYNSGNKIIIDNEGKILVAGGWGGGACLWRYNMDGTPDTTFNENGFVCLEEVAYAYDVTIDGDNKIVITGESGSGIETDMGICRLNPNGTLDTTFGITGYVAHNNAAGGNGFDYGGGIFIDGQGKILVVGASEDQNGEFKMVIWRYNSNGSPDISFNGGYIVFNGEKNGVAYKGMINSAGEIFAAGEIWWNRTGGAAIWKYIDICELTPTSTPTPISTHTLSPTYTAILTITVTPTITLTPTNTPISPTPTINPTEQYIRNIKDPGIDWLHNADKR